MSRAEDLAGVFADLRDQAPAFGFRQGSVVTWDLISASGDVSVGGTILSDVPSLSTGNITYLLPGDTVLLLKQGASWLILGRVTGPGGTHGVGRNTQAALTASAQATNFSLSTAMATKVMCSSAVPVWAEVATVGAVCQVIAKNSTAVVDFVRAGVLMPDGASTSFSSGSVPTTTWGNTSHAMNRQVAVTPGGTLDVAAQAASTAGAWAVDSGNSIYIALFIVYNSNDGT